MPFSFTEIKAVGGVEITRDEMLVNGFMPRRALDGIEPFQYGNGRGLEASPELWEVVRSLLLSQFIGSGRSRLVVGG